ncbi:MAG: AEC family transporter [Treponema sp.]|jgi:predicted permease|nr:AEC family transporter [Treponema sp.]
MEFFTSLRSVVLLMALMIPGYVLQKAKMLGKDAVGTLVILLMYVALPFLLFSSFVSKRYDPGFLGDMGIALALSFVLNVGMYFLARLCFAFMKEGPSKRIFVSAGYLCNCGFMGFPMVAAFFPGASEPIIFVAIFNLAYNILSWSLGIYSITGEKKFISLKNGLLNPAFLAVFIALPFFFFSSGLPGEVMTVVDFLGNMTSPLSMIIVGIRLGEIRFRELFNTPLAYLSTGVKLIAAPLATFCFLLLWRLVLPLNSVLFITLFTVMAMPAGSTVVMFAEMHGGDSQNGAKCTLLSTLLSVATIPALMLLSRWI